MGQLSLSLTDASGPWEEVWVTIKSVEVHCEGEGWQTVATPDQTIDLLKLANGVRTTLGLVDMPTGHCTQVRLLLGEAPSEGLNGFFKLHPAANYAIGTDNSICVLEGPASLFNVGLKLNHEFDILEGGRTDLLLDFVAEDSIVMTGNGKCLLKPVIHIDSTIEQANVSGFVFNGSTEPDSALSEASVSAQIPNPTASDLFVVQGVPAITDSNGFYKLLLAPDSYNIVAQKADFSIDVNSITLVSGDNPTLPDLILFLTTPGTITGLVMIPNSDADTFAILSFRTLVEGQLIEVTSVTVKNNTTYSVNLPPGTYTVEAFTFDQVLQARVNQEITGVHVPEDGVLDITF